MAKEIMADNLYLRLPVKVLEKINARAAETGLPKNEIMRAAIVRGLELEQGKTEAAK